MVTNSRHGYNGGDRRGHGKISPSLTVVMAWVSDRWRGFLILVSLCFLVVGFFDFFFSLGGFYGGSVL